MNTSHDPRVKPYPSFEEFWNSVVIIGAKDPQYEWCAKQAWHARDEQANELLEVLRDIAESGSRDLTSSRFDHVFESAMRIVAKSTKATY